MAPTPHDSAPRFLAIGECMAELAPTGAPGEYRLGFAGDTFNTAWYMARLRPDQAISYFTAVGDDRISRQMRDAFAAGGIDDAHVREVPDRSVGLYLISLDDGERSFSYWRGQSAARKLAEDPAALAAALDAADLVLFSGITLAILDASARATLLKALAEARADGKRIAFDPNLRPRLWADGAAMMRAMMAGAAVCDIALPSHEDEATCFGDVDPDATADRYAAAGAGTVIVKNGPDPVHYRVGEARGTVPAEKLTSVVDTTAAGDAFNAGLLSGPLDVTSLPATIARACRLAAHVVQGKGALVPVDPADLDR